MNKHPVFYTKSDFFDMPSDNAQEANDYLIKMSQTRFSQVFEAKVIAKISSVATRCNAINDHLEEKGMGGIFSAHLKGINESLEKMASEKIYDDSFKMRGVQKQRLSEIESSLISLSDTAMDVAEKRSDELSYASEDKLKLTAMLVKKACLFINSLPDDLSNYSKFPATESYDEISNITDKFEGHSDENNYSTTETRSRTAQIGQVKVSLEVEKFVGEMGDVKHQERWAVNDKPLRAGKLPDLVEVERNPSAEDNDPTFKVSCDIALLEEDYLNEHQSHVSRDLACQYIGSDSDYYKEIMSAMDKDISSQVGNAVLAIHAEEELSHEFGR